MNLIARLEITFLRPEEPGCLITKGGDIDNRLKTLFDALRIPNEANELPSRVTPQDDEMPIFYCLLESDSLVTSVSVVTDRLLVQTGASDKVLLLIHTIVRGTRVTGINQNIHGKLGISHTNLCEPRKRCPWRSSRARHWRPAGAFAGRVKTLHLPVRPADFRTPSFLPAL